MTGFSQPAATHLCASADCQEREWHLDLVGHDLWQLRSPRVAVTMAAAQPVCPICGAPLLLIAALEPDPAPCARRGGTSGRSAPTSTAVGLEALGRVTGVPPFGASGQMARHLAAGFRFGSDKARRELGQRNTPARGAPEDIRFCQLRATGPERQPVTHQRSTTGVHRIAPALLTP